VPNYRAFTLVELVFVIIVIGILASVIVPKSQGSRLREAADQIVSHIRYTQHLAMMDDKFDPNNNDWFKERWQIQFMNSTSVRDDAKWYWSYVIYSDTSLGHSGDPQPYEIARNPMDLSKRLTGGTSAAAGDIKYSDPNATNEMNLGKKYGIIDVVFSNTCSNGVPPNNSKRLAFDYLGRPLKGNIASLDSPYDTTRLMFERCTITFTNSAGENINITIEPETGFAQVVSS
jgi:prepilin-type N-terminal cleavage/methylation domain-containing protein